MEPHKTSNILPCLQRANCDILRQMQSKLQKIQQPVENQWLFLIHALDHVLNHSLSEAPHFEGDCTDILRFLVHFGLNPLEVVNDTQSNVPLEGSSSQGASRGESIGPLKSNLTMHELSTNRIEATACMGSGYNMHPVTRNCFPADSNSTPQTLKLTGASCLPNSSDLQFSFNSESTVALGCTRQLQVQQQYSQQERQQNHHQQQQPHLQQERQLHQRQQQQHFQHNLHVRDPELPRQPAPVKSRASHPSNGVASSPIGPCQAKGVHPSRTGFCHPVSPDTVPQLVGRNFARQHACYGEGALTSTSSDLSYDGNLLYGRCGSMWPDRRHTPDGHSILHESLSPSYSDSAGSDLGSGNVSSPEAPTSLMCNLHLSPTMVLSACVEQPSLVTSRPVPDWVQPGAMSSLLPTLPTPVLNRLSSSSVNSTVSLQAARPVNDTDGEDEVEEEDDEEEFYAFVILHNTYDNDIAEEVKKELESLDIKPGAIFEDFQLGGEHQISSVEKAVDNSAYTLLLLTSNFMDTWTQFTMHSTLMNSINKMHKYNTVIPLLPRTRRLVKDKTPFALQAINPLDMAVKAFDKKVRNTLSSKRVGKQKKMWEAERQRLKREQMARAAEEKQLRQRQRELETAQIAAPTIEARQPEDGGQAIEDREFVRLEAEEGRRLPPGGWNQENAAEGGGGYCGNLNVEGHTVQVNFPPTVPLPSSVGVGGAQNINIINITGAQNVQVGTNNVIQPGPISPACDGNYSFGSNNNDDEASDCQQKYETC